MEKERTIALGTLTLLRQGSLLLGMANAYLCEAVFLKKIGCEMDLALQSLPKQIDSLKKQFPGKFEKEVDPRPLLDDLRPKIEELCSPSDETRARCSRGELGRELEQSIRAIASAVQTIKEQVEGKSPVYNSKEAVSMALDRGRARISELARATIRPLAVLVAAAVLVSGYLFFTMEKEADVRNEIMALEAQAQSSRDTLLRLGRERDLISMRLKALKARELARTEKIESIDLGQQLNSIEEKRAEKEAEVSDFEKKIQNRREALQQMLGKSLLTRMLRM